MSTPLGYHADPWGRTFGELEEFWPPVPKAGWLGKVRPRSLWEVIPNDPDYRKYIPIEYRLNAKDIVGYLAQDLQKGKSAHTWVELAHLGLTVAEIAAETSALVAGLAIAGGPLAAAATFIALGLPYQQAAEEIAKKSSASGYSRGVVMGAAKRSPRLVREYFGNLTFRMPGFEENAKVAKANHHAGLVAGYLHGRALTKNQHAIFWRDLGHRMGDQSKRGPQSQWRSKDWSDWYTDTAAAFRRDHLTA
jgi:hypothetical protein